jgi:hypothetical protein
MKNLVQLLLCFLVAFNYLKINAKNDNVQPVNAILGDISYFEKYSSLPTQSASEVKRIQAHLEYVESLLRNTSTTHLSKKKRRTDKKPLKIFISIGQLVFFLKTGSF